MKSDIDKLEKNNNAPLSLFFATEPEKPPSLETDNLEPIHGSLPPRWHEIPKEPSLNKKNQLYTLNEATEIAGCPSKPRELVEAGKKQALELMVPIPYEYRLGLIHPLKGRWINDSHFCRLPDLVILGSVCCDDLLLFGKAQVRTASKGYTWISSELQLDELFPKDILLFPNAKQRKYCTPEVVLINPISVLTIYNSFNFPKIKEIVTLVY